VRLARARIDGVPRVVVANGDDVRLLPREHPDDLLVALASPTRVGAPLEVPVDDLELLAPVPRPGKIVAVGLNYADHTSETGFRPPDRPLTFAKYPSSIADPGADVVVPDHLTTQVDYEAELAVVVGRRCGGARPATLDDVAGYTVANDISARDVQFADGQWTRAKSFDGFTPLGPWLVTPEEFGDPSAHRIWTTVAGELLQDDTTASMVFDVPSLLAWISDATTLEPGDVILTGTPAGAGGFRTPPRFLAHGEVVAVGVDGVGELRNRILYRSTLG
jgi:2-keto-4-pentenoate hydratase/2-oxohepta-3-ene-1,7-dioic acid hydratase in catechol pathway